MKTYGVDPDTAFNVLARLSSARNEKLRDIAHDICESLQIPR
ncbi:hypothetical protein GCM10028771_17990 [Nocardioides marmoraquaticus]